MIKLRTGFVPAGDACQADHLALQFQCKGHVGHVHAVHHNPLGRGVNGQRLTAIVDSDVGEICAAKDDRHAYQTEVSSHRFFSFYLNCIFSNIQCGNHATSVCKMQVGDTENFLDTAGVLFFTIFRIASVRSMRDG